MEQQRMHDCILIYKSQPLSSMKHITNDNVVSRTNCKLGLAIVSIQLCIVTATWIVQQVAVQERQAAVQQLFCGTGCFITFVKTSIIMGKPLGTTRAFTVCEHSANAF